jgi:outer membrane biosynthesis protein TonB
VKSININLINGLLGTIILHLLAGIIFFYSEISGIYNQTVQIKVETEETVKQELIEKQKQARKKLTIDQIADAFIASQKRSNIGVNISGKEASTIDKELQQTIEEEDAARRQQAAIQENLDNQDKLLKSNTNEGAAITSKKTEKIQGKLVVFKGPTNIYFDLPNRRQIDLYIPVYKCQGNGKVVVNIIVDQAGEVENVAIDKTASDNDDCLFDAASDAASRSRFNSDFKNSPPKQKGSITYLFVAQ